MPWEVRTAMELKKEFVQLAVQPGTNFRGLCRRFGTSPTAGYKWLGRYLDEGDAGLSERSRRPVHSPDRMDSSKESLIMEAARMCGLYGAPESSRHGLNGKVTRCQRPVRSTRCCADMADTTDGMLRA